MVEIIIAVGELRCPPSRVAEIAGPLRQFSSLSKDESFDDKTIDEAAYLLENRQTVVCGIVAFILHSG